jgi:hypothetical protein
MKASVNAEVVEAFDINDKANDVYQHNFGHRPYQVCLFIYLFFPFICSNIHFDCTV